MVLRHLYLAKIFLTNMVDIKCKNCDKMFGKAVTFVGVIKCTRCKMIFEYRIYTNSLQSNNTYDIMDLVTQESKTQ